MGSGLGFTSPGAPRVLRRLHETSTLAATLAGETPGKRPGEG